MVIIVFGLPGSGKSYFAHKLAKELDASYFNSDSIRDSLDLKEKYSRTGKNVVYDILLTRALQAAHDHKTVVIDATFYKKDLRQRFASYIKSFNEIYYIEITADEELIRKRLSEKRSDSDADFEVYQTIKSEWDKPIFPHLVLQSTNENINGMMQETLEYLKAKSHQVHN